MPCYTEPYCTHVDESAYRNVESKLRYYIEKSDEATHLLCEILSLLEKNNIPLPASHVEWFGKHKEWDKLREKGVFSTKNFSITEVPIVECKDE